MQNFPQVSTTINKFVQFLSHKNDLKHISCGKIINSFFKLETFSCNFCSTPELSRQTKIFLMMVTGSRWNDGNGLVMVTSKIV